MYTPTADEIKAMIDRLNEATVVYVTTPTAEALETAKLARLVLHAGIDLVFFELNRRTMGG